MTALYVIGALIIVIIAILLTWGGIAVKYDGEIAVTVRVLFFRFPIIPKKPKKIKLRDFSAKKYAKMLARDNAKSQKKSEKAAKKQAAHADKPEKTRSETLSDITAIAGIVRKAVSLFFSHLRIDVCRAIVTVGGSDATATAMLYGAVSQAVAYIAEAAANLTHFRRKRNAEIAVNADFLSQKITADIEIIFRLRVVHLLRIALSGGFAFIKMQLEKESPSIKKTQNQK